MFQDDMITGMKYPLRGTIYFIKNFYRLRQILIPLAITYIAYLVLLIGGFILKNEIYRHIQKFLDQNIPDVLHFIAFIFKQGCAITLFFILFCIMLLFLPILFEKLCSIMNCSVITIYENGITPTKSAGTKPLSSSQCFILMILNVLILMLMVIGFFLLFWLPFIGQLIVAVVMGFCFGMVYLEIVGSKYGLEIAQSALHAKKIFALVTGYGIAMDILISIPFVGGLMLPVFLIGGAMIMRDYEMIDG